MPPTRGSNQQGGITLILEQDSLVRRLFDISIDALVVADKHANIQHMSPSAESLFGYSEEEILGRKLFILFPEHEWSHYQYYDEPVAVDEVLRRIGNDREIFARNRIGESFIARVRVDLFTDRQEQKIILLFEDVAVEKDAQEKMTYLSYFNQDTGLPNRSYLYKRLDELITHGNLSGYIVGIEMTGLKDLIGTFDYQTINRMMHDYGHLLQEHLPLGSSIFQTDSWKLVALCTEPPGGETSINEIACQVYKLIRSPLPFDDGSIYTDCIIGISSLSSDVRSISEVMEPVDIALHEVIHSGPRKISVYDPKLSKRMRYLSGIVQKLHAAAESMPFRLYVQPQYDLKSNRIVGIEALCRWPTPEGSWISPGEFIPLAETTGLIQQLTDWSLNEACSAWKKWQKAGICDLKIAVNISANILEPGFNAYIKSILSSHGIPARALELEITETALMQNTDQASFTLNDLHDLGVHTAVDDFGTGHSSLGYLKLFKLNKLKIDQSFVKNSLISETDLAIVEAVTRLGHALGYRVLAEGVEDDRVEAEMIRIGCDEMQGFYRQRPMPIEDFESYCKSYNAAMEASSGK